MAFEAFVNNITRKKQYEKTFIKGLNIFAGVSGILFLTIFIPGMNFFSFIFLPIFFSFLLLVMSALTVGEVSNFVQEDKLIKKISSLDKEELKIFHQHLVIFLKEQSINTDEFDKKYHENFLEYLEECYQTIAQKSILRNKKINYLTAVLRANRIFS